MLAVHPVQINPYWQHGGHAAINAISVEGKQVLVNDRCYGVLSHEPDFVAIADFDDGDVIGLIENGPRRTRRKRRSDSALLGAALEFSFSLASRDTVAFVLSSPMRSGTASRTCKDFSVARETVARNWREKIGPRKIIVGDREVADTVEAQTAFILVNATQFAFKPGPRNYDRTWIRDGSSQALALLWAGLIEEAKLTSSGTRSESTRMDWCRQFSTWMAQSTAATEAISNLMRKASSSA